MKNEYVRLDPCYLVNKYREDTPSVRIKFDTIGGGNLYWMLVFLEEATYIL